MKTRGLQIILMLFVISTTNSCKTVKSENLLDAPDTWRKEVLAFPLIFARSLSYQGEEHIRFADGWGDVAEEGYFSYVFIWVLENNPNLTVSQVTSDMELYFNGLMKMGLLTKLRFLKKLPETTAIFKESPKSDASFEGVIEVYDAFFKKENIRLHTKVATSYCDEIKKHIVYFRLSPKDFNAPIWNDLNKVEMKIECNTL